MNALADDELPFEPEMLDRLAEVSIRVGLNLQPEQDLIITAPVEALPLVRRLAAEAYRNGAGIVTTMLSDDDLALARYEYASDESLDRAPDWMFRAMAEAFDNNTARLAVSAANPLLLAGQDPSRVARAGKSMSLAAKPAMERITNFSTNWNIVSYPGLAWAKQVFPDKEDNEAVASLAEAIFSISRIDNEDPIAAWKSHQETLTKRQEWLNEQDFHSLHYKAPGTDLTIGLAEGHAWKGGASTAKNGIECTPNIPTEEVFTTPHADRVEGTAKASKPLVYRGTLIDGIEVRFEDGKIVEVGKADQIKLGPDVQRIDATGKFTMPGIIDSHVHVTPNQDVPDDVRINLRVGFNSISLLRQSLGAGVTTVVSIGGGPQPGAAFRMSDDNVPVDERVRRRSVEPVV